MAALVQQGKSAISGSAPNRSHPRRRNPARVRLASAKTASTRMRSGRCRTSPWLGCGPAVPLRRATAIDNPSGAPRLLVSREDFRKVRPIYSQSANSRSMPMRPSITEAVSVTHRTASYQACQAHEEHAGSRPRGAALALRNAPRPVRSHDARQAPAVSQPFGEGDSRVSDHDHPQPRMPGQSAHARAGAPHLPCRSVALLEAPRR